VLDATTETVRRRDCGGLFVFIGANAETDWLPPEVARDARGYVLTGSELTKDGRWSLQRDPYLLETSVPGIFACGDVRFSPVKRVASAVGEGAWPSPSSPVPAARRSGRRSSPIPRRGLSRSGALGAHSDAARVRWARRPADPRPA
jgi:hypothetical protein